MAVFTPANRDKEGYLRQLNYSGQIIFPPLFGDEYLASKLNKYIVLEKLMSHGNELQ